MPDRDEFNRPRPPQYFTRGSGSYAVCFHCRCRIRRQQRPIGDHSYGEFPNHTDVERFTRLGEEGENARPGRQKFTPLGEEICPGSGTKPIPLAHKFPDGGRIPHYN